MEAQLKQTAEFAKEIGKLDKDMTLQQ